MSARETIRIAHTAKCKLHLAANHPDRNFRLILGHALTLDKVMLRFAEIESDNTSSGEEDEAEVDDEPAEPKSHHPPRRVSFSTGSNVKAAGLSDSRKRRSPPPMAHYSPEDDEDDGAEIDDEDDEDGALSLQRFPSASAQPPKMLLADDPGYEDEPEDPDEPVSPPLYAPDDDEVKLITSGAGNPELAQSYRNVVRCPCRKSHGTAPKVTNMWEIPDQKGEHGGRVALVQVEA